MIAIYQANFSALQVHELWDIESTYSVVWFDSVIFGPWRVTVKAICVLNEPWLTYWFCLLMPMVIHVKRLSVRKLSCGQ